MNYISGLENQIKDAIIFGSRDDKATIDWRIEQVVLLHEQR